MVVAAAVVVVAVAASSTAAVAVVAGTAGVAGAGVPSDSNTLDKKEHKESTVSATIPTSDGTAHETVNLKSTINNQITVFKENIVQQQFFQPISLTTEKQYLSWQENGRTLGSLFAHNSFKNLQDQIPYYPELIQEAEEINSKYTSSIYGENNSVSVGHPEIDRKFSTDFTHLYERPSQEADFINLCYQVRGESALAQGYYDQAVQDFEKAIELNPTNPIPYLERGVANFSLGKYDLSLADYQQFSSQVQSTHPLLITDFSLGFVKGVPKGIYESGRGIFMFVSDVVAHPIQTGQQIYEAFTFLSNLVQSGEWGELGEVLAPEIHQLVNKWDTISLDRRGELAGYVFGKYGADILLPGALAKATAKGLKGTQELSVAYRGLKTAEQTFLLESAAGLESTAKISEIVQLEKRISEWLGEGTKFIKNEAGDPVFLSKDGKRCIRFDFNNTKPHNNPHVHVEIKVDGKWVKSGQIYPTDVPHN